MIQYEVNLKLDSEIYQNFLSWLPTHIDEILKIKGFKKAFIFEEIDSAFSITVNYLVDSLEDLENYFTHHAPNLRQETLNKFGDKFSATRRVLRLLEEI